MAANKAEWMGHCLPGEFIKACLRPWADCRLLPQPHKPMHESWQHFKATSKLHAQVLQAPGAATSSLQAHLDSQHCGLQTLVVLKYCLTFQLPMSAQSLRLSTVLLTLLRSLLRGCADADLVWMRQQSQAHCSAVFWCALCWDFASTSNPSSAEAAPLD